MLKQYHNKTIVTLTDHRTVNLAGTQYEVFPCVLLVQGVHHGIGSDPVYYSTEVLRQSAPFWNNVPVTIGHPVVNGNHVLCNNDGTIRQRFQVGYVTNARFENNKLKGDLYINVSECETKAPSLLEFLHQGGELDVSTGLLAGEDGIAGSWNEENYNASILEIIPDHLALLPNSTGACSWNDGCGVRVNSSDKKFNPIFQEMDMGKQIDKIRTYVDSLDQTRMNGEYTEFIKINYVRAIYSNYFVYEEKERETNKTRLLKQEYSLNENEEIVIENDPVEVVENITYAQMNSHNNSKQKGETNMAEKGCCPEKVKALIANENNSFVEGDQEWLESFNEEQLEKLISNSEVQEPEVKVEVNTEQPTKEESPKETTLNTLNTFLESAPPEIRTLLNDGLREMDNKRTDLITKITANEGNTFDAEQLKNMDTKTLQSIAALIPNKQPVEQVNNFGLSFPGMIQTNSAEEEEPYVPATLSSSLGKK